MQMAFTGLTDVRYGAHFGLKSDIARLPRRAISGPNASQQGASTRVVFRQPAWRPIDNYYDFAAALPLGRDRKPAPGMAEFGVLEPPCALA
jgi:hypothetical protein